MDFELYRAVISGDCEQLKKMESKLSVADQLTPTNNTVLHLASESGHVTCVKEILSSHESLLLKLNSRGETPLHLAARKGHYFVAEALISAAKSSTLQLNHLQSISSSSTVLNFLIRTANVELDTALHEAVRYSYENVVELLVSEDSSYSHPPNKNEETPLYMASSRGYYDILITILVICVLATSGGPHGRTALHAAIWNNHFDCVSMLLRRRKDLTKIADDYGWTMFHYAAYNNRSLMISDLVDADKSVAYIADKKYKRTPLHIAASLGYVKVMEELLEYCPDSYDIVDASGRNILHIAVERNQKKMIKYISTNCKEIKNLLLQKNNDGNTPLHLMFISGCYVEEIMNNQEIDLEALNSENLTPLELIFSSSDTYLAEQENIKDKIVDTDDSYKYSGLQYWSLSRTQREPDYESGKTLINDIESGKSLMDDTDFTKMRETHMVVAALITTVALTAGFAMPGGFDGNAGPKQGTPVLIRKAAFRAFVITDTIALLCSLSSIYIYFVTLFYKKENVKNLENVATGTFLLNLLSVVAIMLAFITGTYAVLAHSLALAITVSTISSFFFILVCYYFRYVFQKFWKLVFYILLPTTVKALAAVIGLIPILLRQLLHNICVASSLICLSCLSYCLRCLGCC